MDNTLQEITSTTAAPILLQPQKYYDCIESCFECASACWISADACLNEVDQKQLKSCINKCLHSAEICAATARLLALEESDSDTLILQLKACIQSCEACSRECAQHAHKHEHCQICMKCCEQCSRICDHHMNKLLVA